MLAGIHIIRTIAAIIPTKLSPTNFPEKKNSLLLSLLAWISVCLIVTPFCNILPVTDQLK